MIFARPSQQNRTQQANAADNCWMQLLDEMSIDFSRMRFVTTGAFEEIAALLRMSADTMRHYFPERDFWGVRFPSQTDGRLLRL